MYTARANTHSCTAAPLQRVRCGYFMRAGGSCHVRCQRLRAARRCCRRRRPRARAPRCRLQRRPPLQHHSLQRPRPWQQLRRPSPWQQLQRPAQAVRWLQLPARRRGHQLQRQRALPRRQQLRRAPALHLRRARVGGSGLAGSSCMQVRLEQGSCKQCPSCCVYVQPAQSCVRERALARVPRTLTSTRAAAP